MATGPVKPSNTMTPLPTPAAAQGAAKAKDAKETDRAQGTNAATQAGAPKGGFDVKVSDEAKQRAEFQAKLLDAARNAPDVREDRVADIKARIAAGTYQVDSGLIADGMLREAIRDHLALKEK